MSSSNEQIQIDSIDFKNVDSVDLDIDELDDLVSKAISIFED